MKKKFILFLATTTLLCSTVSLAGGIKGTCMYEDGSKANGTATISTSWNSKKAIARSGKYSLDLGSDADGATITVYCNGKKLGRVTLKKGTLTTFNITVPD